MNAATVTPHDILANSTLLLGLSPGSATLLVNGQDLPLLLAGEDVEITHAGPDYKMVRLTLLVHDVAVGPNFPDACAEVGAALVEHHLPGAGA